MRTCRPTLEERRKNILDAAHRRVLEFVPEAVDLLIRVVRRKGGPSDVGIETAIDLLGRARVLGIEQLAAIRAVVARPDVIDGIEDSRV